MDQKFSSALKYPSWVLRLLVNLSVRILFFFFFNAFWFRSESKQPLCIPVENDKFIVEKIYSPLHL